MPSLKKSSRKSIQSSDPGKVLDLVISLEDDDCSELQIKINSYLSDECDAELVFAVVVNGTRMEAYIEAVGKTVLEKKHKILECQKFVSIIKNAYQQTMLFSDLYEDVKNIVSPYLEELGKKHILLVPVVDRPFALVVCVVSPKMQEEHVSTFVYECFLLSWPTVKKTIQLEHESATKHKCQKLLRAAKRLFNQVTNRDTLMKLTVEQGKHVVGAEHCFVMIVDLDRMELVETCYVKGSETDETYERRFPINRGIVGHVIQTGTIVNTRHAPQHPAYDPNVDTRSGIDIKNSLTFPIREQTGIIGVGLLINKIGDPFFDATDEEVALSFSVYCGVSIIHSMVYQKIQEANIRNMLANDLVMYHIKVSDAEVSKVLDCKGFHNIPEFKSLHFNSRGLAFRELPCLVVKMFNDLGLVRKFDLKQSKLARFVLQVRKSYRDVPYHNWYHAFSVTQWGYAALMNFQLVRRGYFTDLQALMFLIACLVHDLDHRGTPSNYQINGQTVLAALFTSEGSQTERHHLSQTLCILNTEGCDVLEPLPRRDYDRALLLLRDFVVATDLTHYFKNLDEHKMIASDYLLGHRSHMTALQALLINAADLSDQIKDWGSVKKTAAEVLTEFFNQDETEKGRKDVPSIFLDQGNKTVIPDLEMQFITETCIPLFEMLGQIFPMIAPATQILQSYLVLWDGSTDIFAEVSVADGLSVLLSPELDELIDASLKERERLRLEAEALAAEQAALAAAAAAAAAEEED